MKTFTLANDAVRTMAAALVASLLALACPARSDAVAAPAPIFAADS